MAGRHYSLTEAQQGLWFAQQLAPDNPAFNTAHVIYLEGELNVNAFEQAANQAAREATSLQLRFAQGPLQWPDAAHTPWLNVIDMRDQPQAAEQHYLADVNRPLDPCQDKLACQRLYLLGEGRYAWYVRAHHLVNDGYGMALFCERVSALYACDDRSQPFAPWLPVWQEDQDYQHGERRRRDQAYWTDTLAALPPPATLAGEPQPHAAVHACHRHRVPLGHELRAQLLSLCQAWQLPWPDVLTALTAEYCRRHSDQAAEVVVGVPYMGRLGSKAARLPAMVMNVLPLALRAGNEALSEFLPHTVRELTRGRRHGRYRGEQLRRDLGLIGGQRRLHGPLINVQPFYTPFTLKGMQAELHILSTGPVDDLTLGFRGNGQDSLHLEIEANGRLYSQQDVADHSARLPAFLQAALSVWQHNGRLQDIPLATPAEQARYSLEVNKTAHTVPDTTLVALFEAQMAATPGATALVFNGECMSYAELEQRSRALALTLPPSSLVAVALPRSFELVIALLAIQRAGGAYLPLDASQPDERLHLILDSARPARILTDETERFSRWQPLAPGSWPQHSTAALAHRPMPQDAAYVIYTSGSTGEPKGVVVEHKAIVNRLLWMQAFFAVDASERILQKTPATFDVSVWEFFLPLLSGACLVIAPPGAHQDPRHIARLIDEEGITTLHFVPSMLAAFLATPGGEHASLRRVIVSGEALTASLRDRFHQRLSARLFNLYGPTEAAVDVSWWEASRSDTSISVPIGFPVWNTQLYVLDAELRPQPPGVAGDLYLGGVQLARGYLGQPALTNERFIANPFTPGERLYHSGDVARFRRDGAVEYLGRSDDQIKLRGLRIELGDITHALSTAPGVARGEVLLRHDDGNPRLVAYMQAKDNAEPDEEALRLHLAGRLPDYMVPSAFVWLEHWPLSANGKLDRKALPAPKADSGSGGEPQTATEQALAALFAEQLKLAALPGRQDDFFALGGDSLSAVHLLLAIEARWQRDPGLGAVFANPTVAGLAAVLDAHQFSIDDGLGPYIQLSKGQGGLPPVFAVHPAGGIAWNYRELAQRLPGRALYGLQSPALNPQQPLEDSIKSLAARYVETINELYPTGPVHLLGWSVGGIIAQAMAVRLQQLGRPVGMVALLDAYPAECWRAEPEPGPVAALRALLAIAGYDPEQHTELDTREKVVAFLRRGDTPLGNLPEAALDGVVRAVTSTNKWVREHYHQPLAGTLLHVRAGRDHGDKPWLQSSLWAPYATQVQAIELPFLHAEMTGSQASAALAPELAAVMAHTEENIKCS
ncbi:amino acid adenylation domain-containing protein [Oceanimonas smirnovii]|uniref:amino acid adenylation domain-containing protein n=1 Tax=Oceanimonas smirnovii TaxID=264574 RepID=UPI003FD52DD6